MSETARLPRSDRRGRVLIPSTWVALAALVLEQGGPSPARSLALLVLEASESSLTVSVPTEAPAPNGARSDGHPPASAQTLAGQASTLAPPGVEADSFTAPCGGPCRPEGCRSHQCPVNADPEPAEPVGCARGCGAPAVRDGMCAAHWEQAQDDARYLEDVEWDGER